MLWHHQVHKARGERLYFWRLSFAPTYQRKKVRGDLVAVFGEFDVKSAVCYELFGPYDLLLRVWLPGDHDLNDFQNRLIDRLSPDDLIMCDPFVVYRPVRHWPFPPVDGEIPNPDPARYETLSDEEIEDIEDGRITEQRKAELIGWKVIGDLGLAQTETKSGGVKFAIAVAGDPRLTTAQGQQFEFEVTRTLDAAEEITQRSLYAGAGFGHFLILGHVRLDSFFGLGEGLLDQINRDHIHNDYKARTYTHLSTQQRFLVFHESLVTTITEAERREEAAQPPSAPAAERGLLGAFRRRPQQPSPGGDELSERFEIRERIGSGAFSEVYEATDKFEEAPRAIKFFSADAGSAARVRREIAALRKIDHPRVVRVYWADRASDGRYYLVSELVPGQSLDRLMREGPLPEGRAVNIASQLLEALGAIHPDERRLAELRSGELSSEEFAEMQELQDAGIVHRDVKPGNVMVMPDDQVKLLDFNISSGVGDPVVTQSGTPPYQPPDRVPAWDVSSDLFASGVVLFQMLTDHHPYPDSMPRPDVMPEDPRAWLPNLPLPMVEFLLRAVAPLRQERFQTALDMREALSSAKRRSELETRSDSLGPRTQSLREDREMSLRDLADRSGVSAQMLSQIERGETSPTIKVAKQIASGLGVSMATLLGEAATEHPEQADARLVRRFGPPS